MQLAVGRVDKCHMLSRRWWLHLSASPPSVVAACESWLWELWHWHPSVSKDNDGVPVLSTADARSKLPGCWLHVRGCVQCSVVWMTERQGNWLKPQMEINTYLECPLQTHGVHHGFPETLLVRERSRHGYHRPQHCEGFLNSKVKTWMWSKTACD